MNLNEPYKREDLLTFLKDDFFGDFSQDLREIKLSNSESIVEANSLGYSKTLDLQVFEFKFSGSANKRVSLTKDAFQIMKQSAIFNAVAIYYSEDSPDWRYSFLTATPQKTDKGKVSLVYSNPKRYSFFLGPNAKTNTPQKYLISKGKIKDFDDLKARFSIEVVNKDFYKEVSKAFSSLISGELKLPSVSEKSKINQEFAVRLIGRIIFCWFLREKKSENDVPLMPKSLLSLDAVKDKKHYYHNVLEPIFFEVLNKPVDSRKEDFSNEQFSLIPYLNGGLFTPQGDDFYVRNNGDLQSQFFNTLVIPDDWFEDFFETLETYNFTIDENTSFDEELSIDPEMLGRIFENLLAEINPETGESARKSTGSYYTPRVIVDYMVDESVVLFLAQKTSIDEEKLRALISYDLSDDEEFPLNDKEKESITDALESLKLLDPACGSGAFPMGALQKIVFILQQIDPEGHLWFQRQIKDTSPEVKRLLEREFKYKNFDYIRKLGIIKENIYGVDIQPIATEISRLRCFLTLVVDQYIKDNASNRGIEPLPNLDFKFVTANTLIPLPKKDDTQPNLLDNYDRIDELKEIRNQYFSASGQERERLKLDFAQKQMRIFKDLQKEHGWVGVAKAEMTNKLTDWEPFSHKITDWFDPEWMFGIKNGFDIVIANPPYVDSETMVKDQRELRNIYKEQYTSAKGNWDLYIPFLELGYQLLSNDGVASFITPNKWFAIGYGKEIRKLLKSGLFKVGNCNLVNVFEAGNSPVITLFQKNSDKDFVQVDKYNANYLIDESIKVKKEYLHPDFGLLLSSHLPLVIKVRSQDKRIGDYYDIKNPCTVSEAYEIKKIIAEQTSEKDSQVLKFVNTGTIDPFITLWGFKKTTYIKGKYSKPIVIRKEFQDKYPKRYKQMTVPKLIFSGMRHFESFLDEGGEYLAGKSTEILVSKSDYKLKPILGLLNSKMVKFYISEVYRVLGIDGGINFTSELIQEIPFPGFGSIEPNLTNVVESILNETRSNDYFENSNRQKIVEKYSRQIDQMIYKLYDLTPEEIAIVEGVFDED